MRLRCVPRFETLESRVLQSVADSHVIANHGTRASTAVVRNEEALDRAVELGIHTIIIPAVTIYVHAAITLPHHALITIEGKGSLVALEHGMLFSVTAGQTLTIRDTIIQFVQPTAGIGNNGGTVSMNTLNIEGGFLQDIHGPFTVIATILNNVGLKGPIRLNNVIRDSNGHLS